MTEKLPEVWTTRDYPVLLEVARRLDGGASTVSIFEVAEALGVPSDQVETAGVALSRRGLVQTMAMDRWRVYDFTAISGEAYLLTGLHPSSDDQVSAFVEALRQAADLVEDPVEKGRLRSLADAALGVGREVMGGVLTAAATAGVGLA